MKTKSITLLSIKDNQLTATIEVYDESKNDTYSAKYHNDAPIHDDLANAFEILRYHVEEVLGMKLPADYHVTGYQKTASGDSEIITLYMSSARSDAGICKANFAVRVHLGHDDYRLADALIADMDVCGTEALKYIVQGKRFGMERFITFGTQMAA